MIGMQPKFRPFEAGNLVHLRSTRKSSIEPVGPVMERLANPRNHSFSIKKSCCSVSAAIGECLQVAIVVPQNNYRLAGKIKCDIGAFRFKTISPSQTEQISAEAI